MKRAKPLEALILTLRGHKVMLDADLAELYGVPTKVFNQAVKRNAERFPEDFMFQLTAREWANLKSQIVTSSSEGVENEGNEANWSQIVTGSPGSSADRKAAMRSQIATARSKGIEDKGDKHNWSQFATSSKSYRGAAYRPYAFTEHGAIMAANAAILKRLAEIDKTLLEHDDALRTIWTNLQPLLAPPPEEPRQRMGFT